MRDRDVRQAVKRWLTHTHAGDCSTKVVEEMGVWSGSVRIDIAVINGELSGFELKSDRDTLERLSTQADIYGRVFDRLTLVVGSRHASKAELKIPSWWGIITAKMNGDIAELEQLRSPAINPSPDPYLIAQLLWKEEALNVLQSHDLARGWRSKRVKAIHQRLADVIPFDQLRLEVRIALKHRSDWLNQGS